MKSTDPTQDAGAPAAADNPELEPSAPLRAQLIREDALELRRPSTPMSIEQLEMMEPDQQKAILESRERIITTLRAQSIKMTRPEDWVLYKDTKSGRVIGYLQDSGCQRIEPLWGIAVTNITRPDKTIAEDASFAYTIMGDGYCELTKREILHVEGTRTSTEEFARQQGSQIQIEVAVKKAATAQMRGTIVRALTGLKSVPLEVLVAGSGNPKFEQLASKGRGYGSQAERYGGQMQQADDIKPGEEPMCRECDEKLGKPTVKMKFVPGGTAKQTGRPYPAFWACPDQKTNHKTLPHDEWMKVIADRRAAAQPEHREPGAEG